MKLWNIPNTLIGWLVKKFSGTWFEITSNHYESDNPNNFFDRFMKKRNKSAITLGEIVLYRSGAWNMFSQIHEEQHVKQGRIWGIFFFPAYFITSLYAFIFSDRGGYRGGIFERDARRAVDEYKLKTHV